MAFWQGTAVITGAGSGLGAAMARRFADAGMAVLALDIDGAGAEATAATIRATGGNALAAKADVADPASLAQAAALADDELGGCNVLCANVGVQQFGAIASLTPEAWRWVLDVNVMGVVNTVAAFLPLLRRATGPRRILLTASSAALDPGIRIGAYTTAKFAVMGYGETLRLELADEGIGVSILFPAGMATRHIESSALARPAGLPGQVMTEDDLVALTTGASSHNASAVLTPEAATRHLLPSLEAGDRYIVTHGTYRAALEDRYQSLLTAYDHAQT